MVQGQIIFVWQVEVQYDQVYVFVVQQLVYGGVIGCSVYLVVGVVELFGQQCVDVVVVVDDQQLMYWVFSFYVVIILCWQLNCIWGNVYQCIYLWVGYLWLCLFIDSVIYRYVLRIELFIVWFL